MKYSPAQIIQQLLVANGAFGDPQASALSWPLYVDFSPDQAGVPDDLGVVYDTAGNNGGRIMREVFPTSYVFHYGVQLRVRSQARGDGWAQIEAARNLLEAVDRQTVTIGADTYQLDNVSQTGPSLYLGIEPGTKRRFLHTCNFLCTIEETVGSNPFVPVSSVAVPSELSFTQAFSFNSTSPIIFGALLAGDIIVQSDIIVETPFNDAAASLSLGLHSTPGGILAVGDVDADLAGTYSNSQDFVLGAPDQLELQISPGASSQGSGLAVVQIVRPA